MDAIISNIEGRQMRISIDRYPWHCYHGRCDCPRSDQLHLGWIRLCFKQISYCQHHENLLCSKDKFGKAQIVLTTTDSCYFPSVTAYCHRNQVISFEYVGFLENCPDCITLCAQTIAEPAQNIVVKNCCMTKVRCLVISVR